MPASRWLPIAFGVVLLAVLVGLVGTDEALAATASALGWRSLLVCLPFALIMCVDTLGWRFAFAYDRVPFPRLVAARMAGEAVNVMTAVIPIGGDAVRLFMKLVEVPAIFVAVMGFNCLGDGLRDALDPRRVM